ncbi:MAG: signal peptidase I [Phycisphaerales bacterium]|nr:signal peptidase I [Phycisphaerales bacterium]
MKRIDVRAWLRRISREWVMPIVIVVVVCGAFRSAIADWNDVPTGSMQPTILEGDRILVNKLAYGLRVPFTSWRLAEWAEPQRGDIVICFSPANGDRLVKRVIAVPGDTVAMTNNQVTINGEPLGYAVASDELLESIPAELRPQHVFATEQLDAHPHTVMITPQQPARRSFAPIVVPPDRYFVMGDNRDQSADSRYFGFVAGREIVGRSSRVAFSLDRNHGYIPRWGRFFEPLD